MRGKQFAPETSLRGVRITPADAGKTHIDSMRTATRQDHPRGCGENVVRLQILLMYLGSPPRMRGKHNVTHAYHNGLRITPADAGKTKATLNERFVNQDHPRGCGENASDHEAD